MARADSSYCGANRIALAAHRVSVRPLARHGDSHAQDSHCLRVRGRPFVAAPPPRAHRRSPPRRPRRPPGPALSPGQHPVQNFTLANGLRVIVHDDRKAPVVAVSVWYNVGSKDEPTGKTGFAHLFEHLMFNGSRERAGRLFQPLQRDRRDRLERHDLVRPHQLFRDGADAARSNARCSSKATAWATCSARSPRRSSTTSAASSRTRSARATTSPSAWSNMPSSKRCSPTATPIVTRRSARWPISTPPRSTTCSDWFRDTLRAEQCGAGAGRRYRRSPTARPLVERYFGDIPRGPGQQSRPQRRVPTLPRRVDEVMHDRVADTRLYRDWVVPGLTDEDQVAARRRRRRARRPRQLAARQCAGARRTERGRASAPTCSRSSGSACSRSRST